MRRFLILGGLIALLSGLPQVAAAQGVASGLRVTLTGTNNLDANFDVTLYTNYPFVTTPTGYLGNKFVTPTFGYVGTMINPDVNALEYGDTSSPVKNTDIPLVTGGIANIFRGSFTHTYPGYGSYTLKAGVAGIIGFDSTFTPVTGNKIAANSVGFSVYSPFLSTTTYILGTSPYPVVAALTNTTVVDLVAPPAPPVQQVPTVSSLGLLLLAGLLAGTGFFLMRR